MLISIVLVPGSMFVYVVRVASLHDVLTLFWLYFLPLMLHIASEAWCLLFGKLTSTLKITSCSLKLIFQAPSARVYVKFPEGRPQKKHRNPIDQVRLFLAF